MYVLLVCLFGSIRAQVNLYCCLIDMDCNYCFQVLWVKFSS
uniref:Uncharacterized protein n=1 Tax=Rhizophora mucronata TaxID=61149 RepID=A0A2P2IUF7_RHIMU